MQSWDVSGRTIYPELAEYEGKLRFAQSFERAWRVLEFETPKKALEFVRAWQPDKIFYLNEAESRIMSVWDDGTTVAEHYMVMTDME
jgi:hypothetical protein